MATDSDFSLLRETFAAEQGEKNADSSEEETEAEMWTAEHSGNRVVMIRDDCRLRYNHSTPKRRERERERYIH